MPGSSPAPRGGSSIPPPKVHPTLRPALEGFRAGLLVLRGLRVRVASPALDEVRASIVKRARARYAGLRDPNALPSVEPFLGLLRAAGIDPYRHPPVHARIIRDFLRRAPLAVRNDATDAATLAILDRAAPVWIFDRSQIAPPLIVAPGPGDLGQDGAGSPVIADRGGVLASFQGEAIRARVTEATRELVALSIEPAGSPTGVLACLESLLATLTGAHAEGTA